MGNSGLEDSEFQSWNEGMNFIDRGEKTKAITPWQWRTEVSDHWI